MTYKSEITPDRDVTLEIEIPAEEPTAKINEQFLLFQKRASIPGFRPGKAPMSMIRKRYGKELIAEVIDDLTKEALNKAIDDEKLVPAGRIFIEHKEFGEGKPIVFVAKFPLRPEPKLEKYKGLQVMVNEAEVTDADVDSQIGALRHRHAHLHSIDTPAPANAILTVKYHEVHPSGLELIGRKVEEKQIEIGTDALGPGSDEQLIGIKAGETRVIRVRAEAHGVTGTHGGSTILTPQEAQSGRHNDDFLSISVEAIRVEVPHVHELNDELAQHINPNLNTVDDLKRYTRVMLMSYVGAGMQQMLEAGLIHRLLEANPFPIPKLIIETTLFDVTEEMKLQGEERTKFMDEHRAEAERDYRWVLLRDAIGEAENVEVTDEEVEQELVRHAERTGKTVAAVKMEFAGEEKMENLKNRMHERRVLQILADNAEIEKRPISVQEFLRMG